MTVQQDYEECVVAKYLAGKENAYEVYKRTYGKTHEQEESEDDLSFVRRCAQQDVEDGPYGGAIFQDVYDELTKRAPSSGLGM